MDANDLTIKINADTSGATGNIEALADQMDRLNNSRLLFWSQIIVRMAFAIGLGGLVLAVFFALIYTFLDWVL